MNYDVRETKQISNEKITELYKSVGWSKYIEDVDKMKRAFENSLLVLSAWKDDELLGLVRVIGDGETILYIQDLLVKPSAKRQGIASMLVKSVIDKYPGVRQKVLITDDNVESTSFYQSIGFKESTKLNIKAFVKFEL
jgi:ribosomal protein S18 acetylase RimI-like enzyme